MYVFILIRMSYPNPEHPIPEDDSSKQKAVSLQSLISSSNPFTRIAQVTSRMSLNQKIKSGYIFTVSITILGTIISLVIGDYYYLLAKQKKIKIAQEYRLLSKLRYTTFELQSITRFSSPTQNTKNLRQAKVILAQLSTSPVSFSIPEAKELVAKYKNTIRKLYQILDAKLNKIEPLISNSDALPPGQEKLAGFIANYINSELLDLTDDLAVVLNIFEKKEEQIKAELAQAEILRLLIILIGITFSLTITFILANYINKIITKPLQEIIFFAQKFAQESQLEIGLSQINRDEIGQIVNYLNQLIAKTQSLIIAHKEAEKKFDIANQTKRKFMANISHELLTPLNGILGYTQVLHNSHNLTTKEQRGIKVIHKCAEHLLVLINDILDFSKIEANNLQLNFSDFHLASFLQEIIDIYDIQARQKDIIFIYEAPINLPSAITTDKQRLRQVIVNLLSNAIKFTEQGSVKLQVKVSKISTSEAKINFTVRDTGIGISDRHLEDIFLPFEQVVDFKTHKDGTGLGLSVSQKIVELMGSRIEVSSELGKGSTFSFGINCNIIEEWTERIAINSTEKIIGYSGEQRKILIVEDRWEHRSLIVNILEPIGFYLIEASNGEEGLEKANIYQPDLIISDIYMPILSGWKMLSRIRKSQNIKDIPVILNSAIISDKDRQKSTDYRANGFLTKPVRTEELYQIIKKELKINWKYPDSENILLDNFNKNQQESMVFPPASELIMLLDYAKKGQIKGIITELDKIANTDKEYQAFVNHLNLLLKDFNIKNIRSFLKENIHD